MLSRLTPARSLTTIAIVGVCAIAGAGCGNAIPPSGVATVGGSTITKDEFDHWLESAAVSQAQGSGAPAPDPPNFTKCVAGLKKQPVAGPDKPSDAELKKQCERSYEQLKDQVMQFLIQAEWVQQEAEKRGVQVSEAEVKKIFDDQKKQAFPREADYQKFLEDSGMSEADILYRLRLEQLQMKLTQKITAEKSVPSEEEIKAFYEKDPTQFAVPESRDVSLVLTKTEGKAEQALEQLEDGKSFKSVAKEFSIDEATKAQGGKLVGLTRGQQDKELEDAAFEAEEGELEGPVKAQFGYYVFEVANVNEASQPTLDEVRDRIKNQLRSTNEQEVLNAFVEDFRERYTEITECSDDYRVAECGNAPEDETDTPASGGQPTPPQQAPPGQVPPGGAPPTAPPPTGAPPTGPPPTGAPPAGTPQQVPPPQPGTPPPDPAPRGPASP